jgi:choline dehydrogenase-like flavoprotein
VILAGGAINSPQLLMLSGIGGRQIERKASDHASLGGVGKGLLGPRPRSQRGTRAFHRNMRLDRVALALAQAYVLGKGFASDLPFGITAFLKTRAEEAVPDVQLLFWMGATNAAKPYLPPFMPAFANSFSCRAMPMRPTGRGRVELASADPAQPVRIHQNFLGSEKEWRVMRAGLRMIRDLVRQPPLAPFVGARSRPARPARRTATSARMRASMITVPPGRYLHDGRRRMKWRWWTKSFASSAQRVAGGRRVSDAGPHCRRDQRARHRDRRRRRHDPQAPALPPADV